MRLAAVLLFAGLGLVMCGQEVWARQAPGRPNPLENLAQLDANGDQVVDREEVPEAGREAFDRILAISDANKNGKLEFEELRGAFQSLRSLGGPAEARERFLAMDADKDGKISREEYKGPAGSFDRMDANGDGFVSEEEGTRAYRAYASAQMIERLRAMDADKDGKVSREEYQGPEGSFERLDPDGDGSISLETLERSVRGPGNQGPNAAVLQRLKAMDSNNDKQVSREEFQGGDEAFKRLDVNQDGVISEADVAGRPAATPAPAATPVPVPAAERPDATPADSGTVERPGARRSAEADRPMLARFDKDNDGKVSRDEFQGPPQLFDRMDTDGDGFITSQDRRPEAGRRPGARGQAPLAGRLMRLDKDGDGKVSREEAEGRIDVVFDRIDTNGDGFVTAEEARASAERMRARRSAGAGTPKKP